MTEQQLIEQYGDLGFELLTADGFDDAIIGIDSKNGRVIYSVEKMAEILMRDDEINEDEAFEYLDYNVLNAWVGDQTPIYMI